MKILSQESKMDQKTIYQYCDSVLVMMNEIKRVNDSNFMTELKLFYEHNKYLFHLFDLSLLPIKQKSTNPKQNHILARIRAMRKIIKCKEWDESNKKAYCEDAIRYVREEWLILGLAMESGD